MSVIAEAALAAFFEILFKKIDEKFVTDKKVPVEMNKWNEMLVSIRDVLNDAEKKQLTEQSVKNWLNDLKYLAYDVEDVLDEFATVSLQPLLKTKHEASSCKVQKLIPTCCTSFSFRAFSFNSVMDSKLKKITKRLQDVTNRKNSLHLEKIIGVGKYWQQTPTTCVPDEPDVYGRDEDERKILDLLLTNDVTDHTNFHVLPIVGLGGVGKTTLARQVFNLESVKQKFGPRAWVCVSDDYDVCRITKSILESITEKPCDQKEFNQVQSRLQKELDGKRFLIVLDDVWSDCHEDWHHLCPPFLVGAPGSRIIVTTRDEGVAKKIGTIKSYTLGYISDDDCWKLFRRHAFGLTSIDMQQNLKVICKKVKIKCAGLPLAARTLGGLLRSMPGDRWEEILDSSLWSLEGENRGILPVLRLSYYHLPSHLKRCFSYCSILPKDYEFTEMELVLLWMAEGLIQQSDDGKQMEELGSEYFHTRTDGMKRFKPLYEMLNLRTLLPLSLEEINGSHHFLTSDVLSNLLPKLRFLRVLSFKGYEIFELPESIGELKQLRYLDLSFTRIRCLPGNVVLLCNLQTLILKGCMRLKKLPSRMEKLINLRYLNIENVVLKDGLPLGVKELVSLRTLSHFPVGKRTGAGLSALKNLNLLKGELCISGLENQKGHTLQRHGRDANLKEKWALRVLSLEWGEAHPIDKRSDGDLLVGLQPPVKLEELNIRGFGGTSFPSWVENQMFHKLGKLWLENCKECTSLPGLGFLPSLTELVIERMPSMRSVGCEFNGVGCSNPFPVLRVLCFEDMDEWEDWNPCDVEFPCLNELTIKLCRKLSGKLPIHLSTLKKLNIWSCENLVVSLPSLPRILELRIYECREVDFGNMVEFGSPTTLELERISEFTVATTNGLTVEQLMKSKRLSVKESKDSLFSCGLPNLSSYKVEGEEIGKTVEEKGKGKERLTVHHLEELDLQRCEFINSEWLPRLDFKLLQQLTLKYCPRLVCLQEVCFPSTLTEINLENCDALVSLPNAVGLEELVIKECNSLISISIGQLSSSLKCLRFENCDNLVGVELDSSLVNLNSLSVDECHSLRSLSLSPSLKLGSLEVKYCNSLASLSLLPSLELKSLSIYGCTSLTSISSSPTELELPLSLEHLIIRNCSKLELVAESIKRNASLQSIDILGCDNLRYLPNDLHNLNKIILEGCPNLVSLPQASCPAITSLKELVVRNCDNFKALPRNPASLQELRITRGTPGVVSFLGEGWPTNLITLKIENVMLCKPLCELDRFASLTFLCIHGGCGEMVSFPCDDIGMMLPSSLNDLRIEDFPELKNLSTNGFQNLTKLEMLKLDNCPKLDSFPKNGLPLSLLELNIRYCPLLKQRCQKDKGQGWYKIAHIPCVKIDDKSAFHPKCWS